MILERPITDAEIAERDRRNRERARQAIERLGKRYAYNPQNAPKRVAYRAVL